MPDPKPNFLSRLDFKNIFLASLTSYFLWLVAILAPTLTGYPGVICMTPLAWIMAIPIGRNIVANSRSERPTIPLIEAALAGGLLGLFIGIVFTAAALYATLTLPENRVSMLLAGIVATLTGTVVCTLLATWIGSIQQRRMDQTQNETTKSNPS